jgi:predicted NBD/HSP70 family sugar kinase
VTRPKITAAGDRTLLRRMNSYAALRTLRDQSATVTVLARQLGLSRTAAEAVVRDLEELNWLVEDQAAAPSPMGRPARVLTFNAAAGHVAGLDIGAHKVLGLIADLKGDEVASCRRTVAEDASPDRRIAAADDVLRECLKTARLGLDHLWYISVGSPGTISPTGAITQYGGTGMPCWAGLDLADALTDRWQLPVTVEGDSNLGALAEQWRGIAPGCLEMLYILSGNRTSAGLILGGRLYRGHCGRVGLVGELPQLGWATAPDHVAQLARHGLPPTREAMFQAARAGNQAAIDALGRFADDLATGIAAMVLAVDPELVILGGGVSRGGTTLANPVRSRLEQLCGQQVNLKISKLGDMSVALGSVRLALDHVEHHISDQAENGPAFPAPNALVDILRENRNKVRA